MASADMCPFDVFTTEDERGTMFFSVSAAYLKSRVEILNNLEDERLARVTARLLDGSAAKYQPTNKGEGLWVVRWQLTPELTQSEIKISVVSCALFSSCVVSHTSQC